MGLCCRQVLFLGCISVSWHLAKCFCFRYLSESSICSFLCLQSSSGTWISSEILTNSLLKTCIFRIPLSLRAAPWSQLGVLLPDPSDFCSHTSGSPVIGTYATVWSCTGTSTPTSLLGWLAQSLVEYTCTRPGQWWESEVFCHDILAH